MTLFDRAGVAGVPDSAGVFPQAGEATRLPGDHGLVDLRFPRTKQVALGEAGLPFPVS